MMSPSLLDVQRWMKAQIRPGQAGASSALPLRPQRGAPGVQRLAVYATGYLARMHEALQEVYEAVQHVAGASQFQRMSRAYAAQYPSHDYNLNLAGRHFPAFLATEPLTQDLPFLPDLARLEWAVCQAFHAFEQPPLAPHGFNAVSLEQWERVRLVFQPSVGLVASSWPVVDIWRARTQPVSTVNIELQDRQQRVLVRRAGVRVTCDLLEPAQYQVLERLLAGMTLGDACASLTHRGQPLISTPNRTDEMSGCPQFPLAAWFAAWTGRGLIVRFVVGDEADRR